jgi:hypothetical protein
VGALPLAAEPSRKRPAPEEADDEDELPDEVKKRLAALKG